MTAKAVEQTKTAYREPVRIFEQSGTVNPKASYHVTLDSVVNSHNQDIKTMVDRSRFFSMFAPRQSGKTTFLEDMRSQLHGDPTYVTILLGFQDHKNLDKTEFYSLIERELYKQLINRLKDVHCDKTPAVEDFLKKHRLTNHISFRLLFEGLNDIIRSKKIVILIDEFDGIPLSELENFLTGLRELYLKYKMIEQKALYSVGLIGIRNITKLAVGGISPFNIADQVEMPPFSLKNVRDLYAQYTGETNQAFSDAAAQKIHEETGGQPWLVNRLGTILTRNIKPQTTEPIDEKDVEAAVKRLLKERNAHFDNLYEKAKLYKETFVEIVFDHTEYNPDNEDQTWLEQYGLIRRRDEHAVPANNIYKARYLKTFFQAVHADEGVAPLEYELPGNTLDIKRILLDFDRYITQIGVEAFYKTKKPYEKTGQFLLTAWLYQFVRGGGGDLRYEPRSGLGRMDVLLTYKEKKYIIETKMNRHEDVTGIINDGVRQVSRKYLASEDVDEGYLVVFDTKTDVGKSCRVESHEAGDKKVTSFTIAIGRID